GRATVHGNSFPAHEVGRSITVENGAETVAITGNQLGKNPIENKKEDLSAVVAADNLPVASA
ncbi:MAG: hypothetical protein GY835_28200, partial [bacterium]|nr:hypothetical protein [bacterium]